MTGDAMTRYHVNIDHIDEWSGHRVLDLSECTRDDCPRKNHLEIAAAAEQEPTGLRTLDRDGVCTRCGSPDVHCFCADVADAYHEMLGELNRPIVDLRDMVDPANFIDGTHFTPEAAAIAAARISEEQP